MAGTKDLFADFTQRRSMANNRSFTIVQDDKNFFNKSVIARHEAISPTLPGRECLKDSSKVSPTGEDLEGAYCFVPRNDDFIIHGSQINLWILFKHPSYT
jgi:hypothetical protein